MDKGVLSYFLPKKLLLSSRKYGMGKGSRIRDPENTYPRSRVKKAPEPGSRSAAQHSPCCTGGGAADYAGDGPL